MRHSSMFASFAIATLACASACSSSGGNTGGPVNPAGGSSGVPAAGAGGTAMGTAGHGGTTTASGGAATGGSGTAGNGASGSGNAGGIGNSSGGGGGQSAVGGGNTAGGSAGGGSAQGGSGAGGSGSVGPSEPSGMPIPMTDNVPKPSGTPGNLTVLNWAGFKAAVSFTFDDALSSQISNYSALQGTGVKLTFFLVSNNNGTSATWTQAQKDGHELGNHTAHHCKDNGTNCAWGTYAGSLGAELDQCTMHVTQTFGVSDVWTAASPYGDTGYASPDSSRFLLNRGVGGGQVGAGPSDTTDPYGLPCHTAAMGEVASTFNSATDSARSAGKWQIFLIHSLGGDGGYNPVSITDVVAAINHAKTAGDTWADSMVHVGAYWRAQKLLTSVTPTTSGTSKTWSWTLPAHFPSGRYLRVKVDGGTLSQGGTALAWSSHGYYEVALDAGSVTLSP